MLCPQHNVNYVLRHSRQTSFTLLIYECPVDGCLNTYQEAGKAVIRVEGIGGFLEFSGRDFWWDSDNPYVWIWPILTVEVPS